MAIVQISRITNRKGLLENLPEPLAGAELGWAVDARRLFIGNGTLEDGAPTVGNTEILTEYSDIMALAAAYTYKGEAGGYTVQTGPTSGSVVTQSLQSRLDSYAIVTDFGAVGDGVTDDTAAINRALYQLYCREGTPTAARRSLFFPAGNYLITGTILVPAFAMLYGEGNNASVLRYQIETWTDTQAWQVGTMVTDGVDYYRSLIPVPIGINLANTEYWQQESNPECVIRTADSLQQYGINIGTNGAIAPQSIEIINMGVTTNIEVDGLLIEDASNSNFVNIDFAGPLTTTELVNDSAGISAIAWGSTVSLVAKNIVIDNCGFSGFTWGTSTEQQIKSVVISNCEFDTLWRGIVLGGNSPVNGGPTGVRILHNSFDNIYAEGIVIDGVSLNATGYNTFYDVGNEFAGVGTPFSPIIYITAENNVCVGDLFQRTAQLAESSGYPRIDLNNTVSIATDGAAGIQLGTYSRKSGVEQILTDNTVSPATLFTVDATVTRAFNFNYTITRSTYTRTGTVTVVASSDGAGTDLIIDDSGFQNNGVTGVGVTFSASETASVISVSYTTTNTGTNATVSYSITRLA